MNHFHRTFFGFVALVALLSIQPLRAQYPLSVESYPAVQEGLTTYRFYVNMSDATDRLTAVYGNDQAGMYINTPDGAYNSGFNSSWSASGLYPAFVTAFPEMADDTYATIGLTGPASSSGIPNAADPSIVQDAGQPITPFFHTDGATGLESNTLTGSSWFLVNTAVNGLPNENLQVLILQVTTAGGISGTLNYQVFPLGVGVDAVYMSGNFNVDPQEDVPGCTDLGSCTFNPEATVDDGSCEYLDALGICGGDCDEPSQFNPEICAGEEVFGCTNLDACNYDPMANFNDGSCVGTPVDFCDCYGTVPDTDNDGVCDEDEVAGCTDGMACNYSAEATDEDGSCEYSSCAENAFTLTVDTMAAVQEGLTTYRIYMNTVSATDRVSAVFSNADYPMTINVPEGAWNSPNSFTWNASGVNPALFINSPNIVDDSYATIGLGGPAAPLGPGYEDPSLVDPDLALTNLFTTDGATGFTSDTDPGLSWFILSTALNGLPDADGRVLLMQITTAGSINGTLNYQVFPQGNQDAELFVTATFDSVGTFGPAIGGCMQIDACNYDDTAEFEDGSCEYAADYYNCEGECLIDTDVDGVCDELEVFGCTVPIACNYEPSATEEDGSCDFCSCNGTYYVIIESSPAVGWGTRYQFYVKMSHPNDQLILGWGDSNNPLHISAPSGVFNSPLNSAITAAGIHPAFLPVFPDLADDTYVTIGLSGSAATSGIPGAHDPGVWGQNTTDLGSFFLINGATTLDVADTNTAGWYVPEGSPNALPDDDLRVLLLQVTTSGSLSGTLNFQVLKGGELSGQWETRSINFEGEGFFSGTSENACGCTDVEACNYNAGAEFDDNTCLYGDDLDDDGICDGVDACIGALDACGVCNGPGAIYECGCTDIPAGDCDCDGSVLDECGVCGGDGIPEGQCDCEGNVLDECGVCGGDGIPEGQCDCNGNVLDAIGGCGGVCEVDLDGDGVCDDVDACVASEYCGWGTVWNADSAACVLAVPPFLGQFGDYNTLNPCYYDLDLSGSVGAGDLINFLSTYNLVTGCSWTDE